MPPAMDFERALADRVAEILARCTGCGRCVEVCPVVAVGGLEPGAAPAVVQGVLDTLRGRPGAPAALRWIESCSGSGRCIPACQDGVNPRFMLAMARLALRRQVGEAACRGAGAHAFRAMRRAVRVLSRLQLPPERLRTVDPSASGKRDGGAPPDVVFYVGCNLLRTPHIALLCFDLLERLGVGYQVTGGPGACCGVLQFRAGDAATAGRLGYALVRRLAAARSGEVLCWCPSCQIQHGEIFLPSYTRSEGPAPFTLTPFLLYLDRHLERLRPLLARPVPKRVALHEHPGVPGVAEAARRLLQAIPGLEFVDLGQPRVGWMCSSLSGLPQYKRNLHRDLLQVAQAAAVQTLAGIYHACHRELCGHERDWPFEVVNILELVGESAGIRRPDLFKRLKLLQDADAILAAAQDMIAAHGLDAEEAREVILKDLLGEQPLPLVALAGAASGPERIHRPGKGG